MLLLNCGNILIDLMNQTAISTRKRSEKLQSFLAALLVDLALERPYFLFLALDLLSVLGTRTLGQFGLVLSQLVVLLCQLDHLGLEIAGLFLEHLDKLSLLGFLLRGGSIVLTVLLGVLESLLASLLQFTLFIVTHLSQDLLANLAAYRVIRCEKIAAFDLVCEDIVQGNSSFLQLGFHFLNSLLVLLDQVSALLQLLELLRVALHRLFRPGDGPFQRLFDLVPSDN